MATVDQIYIGADGATSVPITPGNAHTAFTAAINQLPAQGGVELYVTPGSQPYLFGAEVLVDRPHTTIHFSGAAELSFRSGPVFQNMFKITAPGFRCRGARVAHVVQKNANNVDHRSVFRVEVPGTTAGPGLASFQDCFFDIGNADAPEILDFFCIRAVGSSSADPRTGLDVRGTTFFFSTFGVRQTVAWQGADPYGIGAVRAQDTRAVTLTRNAYRGNLFASGLAHTGPMIYLLRAPEAVIASSTFESMDLLLADLQAAGGSLIRIEGDVETPGHHLVFCNNVVEPVRATHILELIGTSCDVVAFSNFGRVGPGDGALRTRPSRTGATGHSLVVFGANFHNAQPIHMIRLEGLAHAVIDGMVFYLFDKNDVPVVVDAATCSDIHFGASQVRRAP